MTYTFSASKLKTFSSCRRQYYYKYIEHLEVPQDGRAVLGRCIHKAVEMGFKGEDPFAIFAQEWIEQSQQVTDRKGITRLYDEGLKMLALYNFERVPPLESELGFDLPFPSEEEPMCRMRGYIDQIFPGHIVVDMKTGQRKPIQGVLDNNPQFIIYSWAYEQLYGSTPSVFWHHLRTGDYIEADVKGVEKLQQIIDVVLETLITQNHGTDIRQYHQSVGFECTFCPFRVPCLGRED